MLHSTESQVKAVGQQLFNAAIEGKLPQLQILLQQGADTSGVDAEVNASRLPAAGQASLLPCSQPQHSVDVDIG